MADFNKNTWTLIAAGDFFKSKFLKFTSEQLGKKIAVDSGLKYLIECNVQPDYCIGDFDSLGYVPKIGKVKAYPADKKYSDMELALNLAVKNGGKQINIFGAMGGLRPEHSISNLNIFSKYPGIVTIYDYRATYVFADNKNSIKIPAQDIKNAYVSIFPISGLCKNVSITGLKYVLKNAKLEYGSSLSLSNQFIGNEASITVKKGILLIVLSPSISVVSHINP